MAKVLVTGGAGYLGSVMVPELLAAGHHVTVVDNFMYRENSLAAVCHHPNFDVARADVRVPAEVAPHLKNADVVIPLAALVGAPICERDPIGATTTNHDAVLALFKQLSKQQLVVMPTTNSAYGSGGADNFCDERSPSKPISRYARDKVAVEQALMEHPNAISYRLATVFGMSPRMRIDLLVNDFTWRAVTDRAVVLFEGHFKRNYLHVRDVARAFLHAISNAKQLRGEIYNVGLTEANVSKAELCEAIKRHVPEFTYVEAPISKDPDQRNYVVSNAKIEATGFRPGVGLDAGIRELIKGYRTISNARYGNL